MSIAEIEAQVAEAIAADERRAARDRYRAGGGSRRRPLKSFSTTDERRARRLEHAAELAGAVDTAESVEGFRDWLGSLMLNPDLSALNCAIISARLGPVLAATPAKWHQRGGYAVAKGSSAAAYVTAPGFKRRPVFTADQVGASDLVAQIEADPPRLPDAITLDVLRGALRDRLRAGAKRSKVLAAFGDELRSDGLLEGCEGAEVIRVEERSDEIPF